jgi:hypothetical protein
VAKLSSSATKESWSKILQSNAHSAVKLVSAVRRGESSTLLQVAALNAFRLMPPPETLQPDAPHSYKELYPIIVAATPHRPPHQLPQDPSESTGSRSWHTLLGNRFVHRLTLSCEVHLLA